jgi:hypothetical protein
MVNFDNNMQQIKTFSDTRLDHLCAFCGQAATTRDHIPSRVLLNEPFPDNLPVASACFECNNGFSLDEEYVACLLECTLRGTTEPNELREKIRKILLRKESLKVLLENSITRIDEQAYFTPDEDRVRNVILKISQGVAKYDNSECQLSEPCSIWFRPLLTMTEEEQLEFFSSEELPMLPEVGSRAMQRAFQNPQTILQSCWIDVQPNIFSYSLSHTSEGLRVRMLIWEYLACEVIWE